MKCPRMVEPGQRIAGYLVEEILGEHDVTVRASAVRDLDGARVILFLQRWGGEEMARRFKRAAAMAQKLSCEHTLRVLDVGSAEDGTPFYACEAFGGEPLSARIARGELLSVIEAAACGMRACEALSEAHGIGLLHTAVCPENVFVAPGAFRLTSYGISHVGLTTFAFHSREAKDLPPAALALPLFLAPEALRAPRDADARADVWSLGLSLYVGLTGKFPFSSDTTSAFCLSVAEDVPTPVGRLRPEVPYGLGEVIGRCLEKDPQRRYQSIAELALGLLPFVGESEHESAQRAIEAACARKSAPFAIRLPSTPPPPNVASVPPPPVIPPPSNFPPPEEIPRLTSASVSAPAPRGNGGVLLAASLALGFVVVLGLGAAGFLVLRRGAATTAPATSAQVAVAVAVVQPADPVVTPPSTTPSTTPGTLPPSESSAAAPSPARDKREPAPPPVTTVRADRGRARASPPAPRPSSTNTVEVGY